MTGSLTDYGKKIILDHLTGKPMVPQSDWFVSLASGTPTAASPGVELTGNGMQRVAVANTLTNFPVATARLKNNAIDIPLPIATGTVGTATTIVFWTAASGGNPFIYFPLASAKTIETSQGLTLQAGSLQFGFTNAGFSDFFANALINHFFGGVVFTPPANYYAALASTAPSGLNTPGTEITAGSIVRRAIANTSTNFPAITLPVMGSVQVTHTQAIEYPEVTDAAGTATHISLFDQLTAGNYLGAVQLNTAQALTVGSIVQLPPGSIVFQLD